ncbi:hypothetical protein BU25DRAFT_172515 [Macroventuria anomochaeta]|uniref:Uncharacterized protein n=1 Tax=Macroventuria anomochaeta TaxID=301207 RepID=A0ACB6RNZ2_9PLEO|nr:uncharacterized protein BU25DRAFT_172515 [Macroventuria anomochaeta]KAF2623675.1 hypothetical protein BU25DRAFT_172515 [Macroventuria anomochaeta]
MARIIYHIYAQILTVISASSRLFILLHQTHTKLHSVFETYLFIRRARRSSQTRVGDIEEQPLSEKQPLLVEPASTKPPRTQSTSEQVAVLALYEKQPLFERPVFEGPHSTNDKRGRVFESEEDPEEAETRYLVATCLVVNWFMIVSDHVEWSALWGWAMGVAVEAAEYCVENGLVAYGGPLRGAELGD